MQIVIDIEDSLYDAINTEFYINGMRNGKTLLQKLVNSVCNGTPLPKGHGRLIDADALLKDRHKAIPVIHVIEAPTVLEADKKQETEFKKKARYVMSESGYLDQGITQC